MSDIKVGDKVVALKSVDFIDGTSHKKGKIYLVKGGEEAYYRVFKEDYEVICGN